jgi:hypothetical protein
LVTNSRIFLSWVYRLRVEDQLITLLMHLLKLQFEPEEIQRHNSSRNSVIEARRQILNILEDSPWMFNGRREEVLADTYKRARKDAAFASGLRLTTFPDQFPWTYEQLVDLDLFPGWTNLDGHARADLNGA